MVAAGVIPVGIGLLLTGVGFLVVGANMRPPGASAGDAGWFGSFMNSTRSGKLVWLIGLLIALAGLKVLIP